MNSVHDTVSELLFLFVTAKLYRLVGSSVVGTAVVGSEVEGWIVVLSSSVVSTGCWVVIGC
jgi:hypothetical protein